MKKIILPFLFIASYIISNAQDISQLEKENGFLNLQLLRAKSDFKNLTPAENANPDWEVLPTSPKHGSFMKKDIVQEFIRFDNDTLREVTIALPPAQTDAAIKGLLDAVTEKYGKVSQTIATPQETVYIWQGKTLWFSVFVTRDTVVPNTFDAKATYTSIK